MKLWTGRLVGVVRGLGFKRILLAASAVLLAAGIASLGSVFLSDQRARAQTPPAYYNTNYDPSNLPGFRLSVQTSTVNPINSTTLSAVYGSPSSPTAIAPSARITALARSLENDPDRIYQFVRNTILFEPQFGLHKGSDGVLLDGAGGAFDQSQLMIDLLRASNIEARYVLGTVTLGSEAAIILRVDTARQACLLLAAAGTPATVNASTDCMSLSGTVTGVQMLHVWVEAKIGANWYAFDPSLKTTNRTTGIDLWAAAGNTNAAAAWNNVSSGVSSGSSTLTGVNPTNIQNDLAAYATALQTTLINNHSDKSLEELAGGWEIVRSEAVLRNATLPGSSGSPTRWTGDVPASYRATLQVETAGFNHTFDLPSIYAWRTQAQLQGDTTTSRLAVAVRKEEHLNAAATAYFTNGSSANAACDGVIVICGTVPSAAEFTAQNRQLHLTINHPYAARRPGLNPGDGQPWAFGTFADERVTKSIEVGKRVDILVRTAGGNGNRKAVWAAANDPIQQHRIVPAGDPYRCAAQYGDQMITVAECDGTRDTDWRYWTQDSQYGIRLFPRGEVARAEMGTKKDTLLNAWTDLFDKTVAMLEPLSGARIFHQHSVGVSLTPSYVENVLDIDTSVAIAPGGADQPHHILSALAALASTEEALAIGQMATERPEFQGSSVQDNAPRRVAASASSLKVLTATGSTSTLPASVSADTRAKIEEYLLKGFSVVATTTAGENAFLARRNDGSEQAWIIRSHPNQSSSIDVDRRVAFRKGAESGTPNPLDYLGKAEARNIAANVAGAQLGAVDLRQGTLSFSEGSEITMGQGGFPYSLAFSRSYSSAGPVEGVSALGMGWTHNWESSAGPYSSDVGVLFPEAEAVSAAPTLIGVLIALQAGRADTLEASVVSGIALDWLQSQVSGNTVSVNGGGRSARFIRLVDGTWRNPASPTETLTPVGSDASFKQFDWMLSDRSVMAFRKVSNTFTTDMGGTSDRMGALVSWTFPTGVVIDLAYGGGNHNGPPLLQTVSNNLGAVLHFEHQAAQTNSQSEGCYTAAGALTEQGDRDFASQQCHELGATSGKLLRVWAAADEISFGYYATCPQRTNFCSFQLIVANRPGLRDREYIYAAPTGALAFAGSGVDYQQVLTEVRDAGVATPRARFDWRAVGGQVAPYVAEAFDAQDRKTVYYSSTFTYSSAKDAENAVVRQTYEEDGRLATSADALGRTARATYDGPGRSHTVQTPYGDLTSFVYDPRGNLIERTQNRPVTVIDSERRATHTIYNAAGQPIEIQRFQRAAAGSCSISTELPQNAGFTETRWRRFGYNAAGMQTSETDARGNVTQQEYDGLGRPARTIYADGAQAWTAMDQRGQAVFRRQRGGSRAAVFYDAAGRDFHVREFAEVDKDYMFKGRNSRANYDLAGRPVWRDVSSQTTLNTTFDDSLRRDVRSYGYDTAGRINLEQWRPDGVGGISFTTGYGYDAAGNRTSIAWPGAWTATYAYDAANRIQTVNFPGAAGTQTVTLSHDSLSRRTGINRAGTAADSTYAYEPDNDLVSLGHAFVAGNGPGAVSFSYGHDAAGKTTSIGISQPAFEWMPSLSYATAYGAANVLNQIGSAGGVGIGWTTDGNMSTDGINTYTWGYGNRMIGASRSGMTATYDYDSDDRRTKKTVNGLVTRMLWSGGDELAEYDVNGDVIRRFVPDGTGAMDARLATVTSAGAVYWHHVDHQGSVIATSDGAGQTVGVASYSPYGEFGAGTSAPPQHSPFGYTGRQYDAETGLYQYRARYYSPKLGQFLSMDPSGTKDDSNLYLYVGADPVNHVDPDGNSCRYINMNMTSPFCVRSQLFAAYHYDPAVNSRTTFFQAASFTVEALANMDIPVGGALAVSPYTQFHLKRLSAQLEGVNRATAGRVRQGEFRGSRAQVDRQLVRMEQRVVQGYLDTLSPLGRAIVVNEANSVLNSPDAARIAGDGAYAGVIERVQRQLGGSIDYGNENHRVAMGDAITSEIRNNTDFGCGGSRIQRLGC